jgi:CheY-like chemotaxis protein
MDTPIYRILIVDDNPDWRLTFKGILQESNIGFDIQGVDTTEAAIELLKAGKFDLALLDIRLDDSDESDDAGLKLAETISLRWPATKVIFATGYANEEYVKKAMESKGKRKLAVGFIQKQNVENLINIIQRALR